MTVRILTKSIILKPDPFCKVYLEIFGDRELMKIHFTNKNGDHIDGYYLFSFDHDYNYSLRLWTSVGSKMKDMELVGRSQLKVIGVDLCEEF